MSADQDHFIIDNGLLSIQFPELWECTARLRWNNGVLQQCWWEKSKGGYEWRDVPTAEECEIK